MKLSTTEKKILNTLITNQDHVAAMDVKEIAANIAETQQYTKTWINKLHGRGLIGDMEVNGTNTVYQATDAGEKALKEQEENQLKFEGLKKGQVIKAYDHQPRSWIEDGKYRQLDHYLVGEIEASGTFHPVTGFTPDGTVGPKVYKVNVIKDTTFENEPRETAFVPMQMATGEFDQRITLIEKVIA